MGPPVETTKLVGTHPNISDLLWTVQSAGGRQFSASTLGGSRPGPRRWQNLRLASRKISTAPWLPPPAGSQKTNYLGDTLTNFLDPIANISHLDSNRCRIWWLMSM